MNQSQCSMGGWRLKEKRRPFLSNHGTFTKESINHVIQSRKGGVRELADNPQGPRSLVCHDALNSSCTNITKLKVFYNFPDSGVLRPVRVASIASDRLSLGNTRHAVLLSEKGGPSFLKQY
jgi:hypothetical protein